MSWFKKELNYLKESFSLLIKGFLLFLLAFSGLGIAILLRFLQFNGTIIAFIGIITETIALTLGYFIFRKYIKLEQETKSSKTKKK
jgi:multisubunit Na+/H+ antiporter MnhB subunit